MSIITTQPLAYLWRDAQAHPEWATTRLWEYLFNRVFFSGEQWFVSSQQPPTHQPREGRRVDLVVEKMDSASGWARTILFMEAKRASASPGDVVEVECQAYTAACAIAVHLNSTDPIWTMTCVGSKARLWIFHWNQNFLIPFYPETCTPGEISEYIEISEHGRDLHNKLNYIKQHPLPPAHLLEKPASPRPTNQVLPHGWHAYEVEMRDAQHQEGGNEGDASTAGYPSQATLAAGGTFSGNEGDTSTGWNPSQATGWNPSQATGWDPSQATGWDPSQATSAAGGTFSGNEGDTSTGWNPSQATSAVSGTLPELEMNDANYQETSAGFGLSAPSAGQYGQGSTQEPDQDDPAEGSSTMASMDVGTGSNRGWVEVKVEKKRHGEYWFRDNRGQKRTTSKEQWQRTEHDGRIFWVHHGKRTTYYTFKKIGS